MRRLDREILRFCDEVIAGTASCTTAIRIKEQLTRRAGSPAAALKGSTRANDRAAKKQQWREEMAALREAVFARAAGRCEVCGIREVHLELAHLNGGRGRRRQQQSVENCVAAHHDCHCGPGGLDKQPQLWICWVKEWCSQHEYPLPERWRILEAKLAQSAVPRSGDSEKATT